MNPLPFLSLAALALSQAPGEPPRLPIDPAVALEQPYDAPDAQQLESSEGWRSLLLSQSWFGLAALETRYRVSPEGRLQSITIKADSCEPLGANVSRDLGAPDAEGPSPHFLFSLSYRRWQREGVAFVLEDFAPGCELGIHRTG